MEILKVRGGSEEEVDLVTEFWTVAFGGRKGGIWGFCSPFSSFVVCLVCERDLGGGVRLGFSSSLSEIGQAMPVKTWQRNEIVQLNVGGQKFTTTVDTLTKESESMLGVWFSGRHDVRLDTEGRVFIDRDGYRFRHILNFLRNGSVHISGDIVTYQEVLEEAEFFGNLFPSMEFCFKLPFHTPFYVLPVLRALSADCILILNLTNTLWIFSPLGIRSMEERLREEIQKLEALGHEENLDHCIPSQTSDSGVLPGDGGGANPALLLTGSWLLQQHQQQHQLKAGTTSQGTDGGVEEASSSLTTSHQTEYRFSLDEDF